MPKVPWQEPAMEETRTRKVSFELFAVRFQHGFGCEKLQYVTYPLSFQVRDRPPL